MLRNFAKRLVLAYEADAAGLAGAGRVYEWERHHEIDVAVAALPAGSDPGDLASRDPEALRAAVSGAQPFLRFRVERVLADAELTSAEGRAKAAEAALGVVVEHPNELVRDQYLMLVADRCRLDPAVLRPLAERLTGERRTPVTAELRHAGRLSGAPSEVRQGTAPRSAPPGRRGRTPETLRSGLEARRLAVHRPELVDERLEACLFTDPLQRAVFEVLASSESLHEAMTVAERGDPEVAGLLRRLTVEEPAADADDVVVQLVRIASRRALADVEAQARLTPDALAELAPVTASVRHDLDDLEHPEQAAEAARRLVAWLAGSGEENG